MSITRLKPPFNCVPYEMPIFFLNKNVELLEKCWITRKMCTDSVKFRSNLINRSKRANRMDLVHSHYPPSSAKLCATGKKNEVFASVKWIQRFRHVFTNAQLFANSIHTHPLHKHSQLAHIEAEQHSHTIHTGIGHCAFAPLPLQRGHLI